MFRARFQQAPTLGGECYLSGLPIVTVGVTSCFNKHPPLGVNATKELERLLPELNNEFQQAPTLGGECYARYLGVMGEE